MLNETSCFTSQKSIKPINGYFNIHYLKANANAITQRPIQQLQCKQSPHSLTHSYTHTHTPFPLRWTEK